ncbi:MAG: hypothetical protein HYU39_07500 [Thaumarchaeota archaeon]|nr:hypothetical protein [Nitrososphaerota archaeon]
MVSSIPFIPTFGVIRKTVRHIDDAIRGVRKVDLDDLTAATKKIGGLMDDTLSHRGHFEDMKANGLVEAQTFEAFQQEAKDFVHKGVTAAKSGDSNYKIYAQNDGAYAIVDTKRQIFAIYDPEQDKVRTFFSPLQGDAEHRSITMQQYIEMKLEAGRQGKTEGWRPTG